MKFLYTLFFILTYSLSTLSQAENTTIGQYIKISAPTWYFSHFGQSITQVWLINKNNKIQYINNADFDANIIELLKTNPLHLKNKANVTYSQLIKAQPQLEKPIQSAFKSGAQYVLLDVSPDKSLFKGRENIDDFCPPCKKQTDALMSIANKKIIVLKLRMAM